MKNDAPCKGCADREIGCHAAREKYKEWIAAENERKKQINKQRQKLYQHDNYVRETKRRLAMHGDHTIKNNKYS